MEIMTENILQKFDSQTPAPEGRLVFDKNRSRYLHTGFWATMCDEIRDLKFTLQEEFKSQGDTFLFPHIHDQAQPAFAHPPISESDFLLQTFIEKVDPFIKILHKPTLQLELNHLRRGILANPTEFQCRLFAVYSLALLPMCSTSVEYRLHETKKVLLSRYRSYVEHGLSQMHLTTTQSIPTLQTFLLYIIELRRRLWHHLVLLDAWCVENHGVQPMSQSGDADTAFPQNQDDLAWDTCEFATFQPEVQNRFTDTTVALLHYEIASLTTFVLGHPYTPSMTVCGYLDLQNEVLRQAHDRLDILYIRNLDAENDILQQLTRDLFEHAFRRLRLMQLQPILNAKGNIDEAQRAGLEAKLYQLAIEYCKITQNLITFYAPHSLDWPVIRAFSWHSVATMLSMVLRHEALSNTAEARVASRRIEELFQNRPSIDYLAGNDNLWEPLKILRAELAARESGAAAAAAWAGMGTGQGRSDTGTERGADLVSMTSTSFDPSLFGLVGIEEGEAIGFEHLGEFEKSG